MSARDDNDSAFPSHGSMGEVVEYGMTLRDYFAAKAPIGVVDALAMAGYDTSSVGMLTPEQRVVVFAILAQLRGEYADAMLLDRIK